jgi:cell division protein FtsI (penicillin-binding protein 3)
MKAGVRSDACLTWGEPRWWHGADRDAAERPALCSTRHRLALGGLCLAFGMLVWRALVLQIMDNHFLRDQGDARVLRVHAIAAHRGMITDRMGEPLAISTPVSSVWANPQVLLEQPNQWSRLAKVLGLNPRELATRLNASGDREFVYVRRRIPPDTAQAVADLQIPGVYLQREYRRYYPNGEVTGHLLGFTDIDDEGQEGIELAYNKVLRGEPGAQRVMKDRYGTVVEDMERIREPRSGRDLALSVDLRLQYLLYRELKAAVLEHGARGGSAVLLDALSGEVLAVVNQPAFNPNSREDLHGARYRNRAVTDLFEPGSTVKPFTIACALESGLYKPSTLVDTRPGLLRVGSRTIHDVHDYGIIDVATVIKKSSNVGAGRIALSLPAGRLWNMFVRVGFGSPTSASFPGEPTGVLRDFHRWRPVETATAAFGYGLSVTPLQLARAYAILAADGVRRPVSLLRVDKPPQGQRVIPSAIAAEVRRMMEAVVREGGTGTLAAVPGYRVAGKTGTVRKAGPSGYAAHQYYAVFAGMAPASRPRLVLAVVVNDPNPKRGGYYGGQVAAPVFRRVMGESLRMLDVPPDEREDPAVRVAWQETTP